MGVNWDDGNWWNGNGEPPEWVCDWARDAICKAVANDILRHTDCPTVTMDAIEEELAKEYPETLIAFEWGDLANGPPPEHHVSLSVEHFVVECEVSDEIACGVPFMGVVVL